MLQYIGLYKNSYMYGFFGSRPLWLAHGQANSRSTDAVLRVGIRVLFEQKDPNIMGPFYVRCTPNIMEPFYALSSMGPSYVHQTHNIMGLF